jgi:hypothetical protein
MARELQRFYLSLVETAARGCDTSIADMLGQIAGRSAVINHFARITGDAVDHASTRLIRNRRKLSPEAIYRLIRRFAADQEIDPDSAGGARQERRSETSEPEERVFRSMTRITLDFRESL